MSGRIALKSLSRPDDGCACAAAETWFMEDVVKIRGLFLAAFVLNAAAAIAQDAMVVTVRPLTDDDIKLMRQDIQASKEAIIKDTMQFTDTEGTAFWPIYKQYAQEQHAIADKRLGLINDYANKYDTLTDADAKDMTKRMFQIEEDTQSLRKKYLSKFESALGAKRAAKFYQVDNRLSLILNVQIASAVPLIQ